MSKTEVETFCRTGRLDEKTVFGSTTLLYCLQASVAENMDADFYDREITMYIPSKLLQDWATNTTVGFSHNKPLPDGDHLFLLLEKDFKCIDSSVPEDQSDNYDNPLHVC